MNNVSAKTDYEVYPDRPPYWAMKQIRLMTKTCAAQEIGPTGFVLVSVIVTTEDAAGYRRPVTYFDGQLMPLVGVESQKSLASARRRCVDAGWLHYEPGGKGRAARYWATVPIHADDIDDNPTDEGDDNTRRIPRKKDVGTVNELESKEESIGDNATGQRSNILPIPSPTPKPSSTDDDLKRNGRVKTKTQKGSTNTGYCGWPFAIMAEHLKSIKNVQTLWEHALRQPWGLSDTDRLKFFTLAKNVSRLSAEGRIGNAGAKFTSQLKASIKNNVWPGSDSDELAAQKAIKQLDGTMREPSYVA